MLFACQSTLTESADRTAPLPVPTVDIVDAAPVALAFADSNKDLVQSVASPTQQWLDTHANSWPASITIDLSSRARLEFEIFSGRTKAAVGLGKSQLLSSSKLSIPLGSCEVLSRKLMEGARAVAEKTIFTQSVGRVRLSTEQVSDSEGVTSIKLRFAEPKSGAMFQSPVSFTLDEAEAISFARSISLAPSFAQQIVTQLGLPALTD